MWGIQPVSFIYQYGFGVTFILNCNFVVFGCVWVTIVRIVRIQVSSLFRSRSLQCSWGSNVFKGSLLCLCRNYSIDGLLCFVRNRCTYKMDTTFLESTFRYWGYGPSEVSFDSSRGRTTCLFTTTWTVDGCFLKTLNYHDSPVFFCLWFWKFGG